MVDTMEAMLDTLEPTTANFTLSSHHNLAWEDYTVVKTCCISIDHPVHTSEKFQLLNLSSWQAPNLVGSLGSGFTKARCSSRPSDGLHLTKMSAAFLEVHLVLLHFKTLPSVFSSLTLPGQQRTWEDQSKVLIKCFWMAISLKLNLYPGQYGQRLFLRKVL